MPSPLPPLKSHRDQPRPPFEQIVLLLQGGGALGAYQAGVYEALAEAGLEPDWVAGISIGAINSAIIAGNPPGERVAKLRTFWEVVTDRTPAYSLGVWGKALSGWSAENDMARAMMARLNAAFALTSGATGFFRLRVPPPWLAPAGSIEASSYYDTKPLRATLERLVDFDRINRDEMRMTIAAVNVRSGNFVLFDTRTHDIGPEHVMASGALPPGFPPVEIEGEHYWDGGLVSNTPLQWVLEHEPQRDTLAFQVDLWNARGELPRTIMEVATRQKDIQYSSRTRANTDRFRQLQRMRCALHGLLEKLPEKLKQSPEAKMLAAAASQKVYNIVHLIYRAHRHEADSKDYEFSRGSMEAHWRSGYQDTARTLRHPEVLQRPQTLDGVWTFDLARDGRE
jgi:NTE family protein